MKEKLELLQQMMSLDFNSNESEDTIEEVFSECFKLHSYEDGDRPVKTLRCGGCYFSNTPKTLYRLLYLLMPYNVNFSGMCTIFEIHSSDYSFCASIQFYNYELLAYFHCAVEFQEYITPQVVLDIPGLYNSKCISDIGNLWYKTLRDVLEYEHEVYPGNNFKV